MTLPEHIAPMLAVIAKPFDDPDFLFEVKWDGLRCIAFFDGQKQRLQSRNFKEFSPRFPELSPLGRSIEAKNAVVDGEIVTFYNGKPNFLRLQPRIHARTPSKIEWGVREAPVVFIAFDLLFLNDRSLMSQPLKERRSLLTSVAGASPILQLSEATPGQGIAFFEAVKGLALEGIVGKDIKGQYLPGKRSPLWRKIKVLQCEPFVICGYTTNPTGRKDLSAMALGGFIGNDLVYFGLVGTGLSQQEIDRLLDLLAPTTTDKSPFTKALHIPSGIHWVKPQWVCDVEYLELTGDAHLRHPLYRGLRTDLSLQDCVKG